MRKPAIPCDHAEEHQPHAPIRNWHDLKAEVKQLTLELQQTKFLADHYKVLYENSVRVVRVPIDSEVNRAMANAEAVEASRTRHCAPTQYNEPEVDHVAEVLAKVNAPASSRDIYLEKLTEEDADAATDPVATTGGGM